MYMTETELHKIKNYLSGDPAILVSFLYGSQVTCHIKSNSDVDIALLYVRDHLPNTERRFQLVDDLISITKREVDLLILNDASPVISMQVLRKGKIILERDHQTYLNFFVKTVSKYDDLKRVRSGIEQNLMKGRIYG